MMPATDRSLDAVAFVTDHFRDILRRRLSELAGLALITLALLAAVALATWSVQDPSLSHATQTPVRNLLGFPGAIFSDLAMQLLGLAAVLLLVPEALLGWRLLSHRPLGEKWRGALWIVATLLAAGFAATLPRVGTWPLPTGLGGVIGDAVLRLPAVLAGWPLHGVALLVAALVLGLAAAVMLGLAAGFDWPHRADRAAPHHVDDDEDDEEEDGDHASAWLGMIAHAALSWKARIGRWLRNAPRQALRAAPAAAGHARSEPRFDALGRVAAPHLAAGQDDDFDEDAEDEAPQAAPRRRAAPKAPVRRTGGGYALPSLNLLTAQRVSERTTLSKDVIDANAAALESVLGDFGVRGEIINARPGPVVTLYELEPAPGIKSSRVIGLADDIARSMSAVSARVAVVSGRNAIGIELPNPTREKVYLRELLSGDDYSESAAKLPLCLGKTIGGESVIVDLARMPHLLIAGTTGSGKSVAINTMILSLVYRLRPEQCRLIMVDPKMLELSVYDGIPHLLTPVVTDPKKAVVALKWAVREMEERYKKMSKLGVRNIDGYNARVAEAKAKGEMLTRTVQTGYDKETGEAIYEKEELELEPLPYPRGHRRRDGRPDDGRRQGHRRRHPAPGADGARRRHPRDPGHAAARRSTSSPAPSRRISRPASRSRSRPRSTAARSSASRAPSSSWARATCSTWPAAAASAACTDRSCPTTRSRRWCATSSRRATRNISRRSPPTSRKRARTAPCSMRPAWGSPRAATSTARRSPS